MKKISGVLNTSVSKVASRFVNEHAKPFGIELATRNVHYSLMLAELFEHLLLFDEVAIVMNVDNSPLGILISEFGLNDTAKLIETGAIKLILRRVLLVSKTGNRETGISEFDGIPPVLSGMIVGEDIFDDPVKCINDAFRYVGYNYRGREREIFLNRILPYVIVDAGNSGDRAIKLLTDAYHSNSLSTLGLPYTVHENSLLYNDRGKMLDLASQVTDLMLIASSNYGMYNQMEMYDVARKGIGELLSAMHISNSMNEITTTAERMPNLKELFLRNRIGFHSLVKIRQQSDSQKFRSWLNEKTKEDDSEYIINQYIDAIAKQSGLFNTTKGKFIKSMLSLGIGVGVSSATAALFPVSPLIIGTAGAAAVAGTKIFEHVSNEFLNNILGSLGSGWTPRLYLDSIKKSIND